MIKEVYFSLNLKGENNCKCLSKYNNELINNEITQKYRDS